MQDTDLLILQLNQQVTQARYDIYLLSALNDSFSKQQIFQRLWSTITTIQFLSDCLSYQITRSHFLQTQLIPPTTNVGIPQLDQHIFTIEELENYDGKNGRPSFVAVKDLVYDVTNISSWAAATHFGLKAGKDHTGRFEYCHTGQQEVLKSLPVVGRLMK